LIRLSIIIPTYNRRELLLGTLRSLETQSLTPSEFEVIVVVDGSTDGTIEALKDLKTAFLLKTYVQENQGQAAARNAGAQQATSELLLFVDDDINCSTGLLAQHLLLANDQKDSVVFGPVFLAESPSYSIPAVAYRRYAEARFSRINRLGPVLPQDAMLAPNSSIHAELFRRAGGYETTLERLEDIELGYRLWKLGTKFVYSPAAVAYHSYDKNAEKLVNVDAVRFGISDLKLCRIHQEYWRFSTTRHFVEERSFLAWLAATLPFSPDPVLAMLYRAASSFGGCTGLAIRLLQVRQGIAALRSAVAFAGGWAALKHELHARTPHA
jgi:glycosyltransferase involved in cell wall biosynthesis